MKKLLFMLILCLASLGFSFDTWDGSEGVFSITTGYDAGDQKSGYWFSYNDNADGGASSIEWPVTKGNEYDTSALDPVITYCNGICGTYKLDAGTLTYNPFVGVGFNMAGENDETADATAMNGICVTYTSDAQIAVEMGLGASVDADLGYDNPFANLAKSTTSVTKDISWSTFKQAGWGKGTITGAEAASKLVSLKFKIQGATGSTGTFNIQKIGTYGKCAGTVVNPVGIKTMQTVSTYKLNNNILTLNDVHKVSVFNINGVLIKSEYTKTMDFNKLNAGKYIVNTETQIFTVDVK